MNFEKLNLKKFDLFVGTEITKLQKVIGGWVRTEPPGSMLDRAETMTASGHDGTLEESTYHDDNGRPGWP